MATKKDSDDKRVDEISDKSQQISIESGQVHIGNTYIAGDISGKDMTKPNILFVGSDTEFLVTKSEFLRRAGYEVVAVQNLHEAKEHLEREKIDLAIVDVELLKVNDNDEDYSALALTNKLPSSLPKIILSKSSDYKTL